MSTIEWVNFLIDLLCDESAHFWLALASGLLGAWSMSIMLSAPFWVLERLTRRNISTGVAYGILCCCLLGGLSCALASHWALDYLSSALTTPLGPALNIK